MQEYIVLLSKKHGQLKQAITLMTQEAMQCLEQTPDMKTKLELIDTLRTVTDGKVLLYVNLLPMRSARTITECSSRFML